VRELYYSSAFQALALDRAMEHLQRAVDIADPLALYVDVFSAFARLRSHRGYDRYGSNSGWQLNFKWQTIGNESQQQAPGGF